MKTIKVKLYSINELSSEARNKALSKYVTINVEHDWYDSIYEDAEQVGLKITGFDLDRNKHATGQLILSTLEVAQNIINNHGENCNTYKTAQKFLEEHAPIFADYMDENSEHYESLEQEGKLQDLESDFKNDLLTEYANILQKEYDYLTSDEQVKETILANEYTFEADGKMNNTQPEQEQVLENTWDFVEKYYPNYSSSDEICEANDLNLILERKNSIMDEEGTELHSRYMEEFDGQICAVMNRHDKLMKEIYEEAIQNFINIQNK